MFLQSRFDSRKITSVIAYDSYNKKVLPINRYRYSTDLSLYLEALFAENKKDEQDFKSSEIYKRDERTINSYAKKLLDDATEYILLNLLSNKANDYYQTVYKKKIEQYTNVTLYENLNQNIFFETFTRAPSRRKFSKSSYEDLDQEKLYFLIEDGLLYNKFELFLPENTRIIKNNDKIIINMRDIVITFRYSFFPYGFTFKGDSNLFTKYYMKQTNNINIHYYKSIIEITTFVKFSGLLPLLRKKYDWIDSFPSYVYDYFDFIKFLEDVNWNSNATSIIINS